MKKKQKRIEIKLKDREKVLDSAVRIQQYRELNGDKNDKINILLICKDLEMTHDEVMPIIMYLANKDFLEYIPPSKEEDILLNVALVNGKLCQIDTTNVPPQDYIILKNGRTYFEDIKDKKRERGVSLASSIVSFVSTLIDKMSGLNIIKTIKSLLKDSDS